MENSTKNKLPLLLQIEEYGKTSFEILKFKLVKKLSVLFSKLILNFVFLFIAIMILLCLTLGISFWLGEYLGNISYGFYCVALFYAFIALILYFVLPRWTLKIIRNRVINELLD